MERVRPHRRERTSARQQQAPEQIVDHAQRGADRQPRERATMIVRRPAQKHRDDRDQDQQIGQRIHERQCDAERRGDAACGGLAEHEVPERRADARHDHPRVEQELPAVGGARAHREGEERGERERIARDEEHIGERGREPAAASEQGPERDDAADDRDGRRAGQQTERARRARRELGARRGAPEQRYEHHVERDEQNRRDQAAALRPGAGEAQPEQIAQRRGDRGRRDDESGGVGVRRKGAGREGGVHRAWTERRARFQGVSGRSFDASVTGTTFRPDGGGRPIK